MPENGRSWTSAVDRVRDRGVAMTVTAPAPIREVIDARSAG